MNPPRLDPRSWDDLRRELIRRVPMHAPEWTDLGPSDPGVALIELFAWLGERLLRRMDQIPAETEDNFLRLLGLSRRSASPARALVRFSLQRGTTEPLTIPLDASAPRLQVSAGSVRFQVRDELQVLPVESLAVVKKQVTVDLEDLDAAAKDLVADSLGEEVDLDQIEAAFYETTPLREPKGGRLSEAVSLATTVDGALWVALLAPEGADQDLDGLRRKLSLSALSLAVIVEERLNGSHEHLPAGGARSTPPSVQWQLSTGTWTEAEPRYQSLSVLSDATEGLRRSGVVRLRLPKEPMGVWSVSDAEGNALDGVGSLPPALDDPRLSARLLGWVRGFRTEGGHPEICWAATNVVEVEQSVTRAARMLGAGTGQPGLTLRLPSAPVIPDSLALEVRESDLEGWRLWSAVQDLSRSRGDDPHYMLDPATGQIRFGDGIHGRMPGSGEAVRARTWRTSVGAAGNVPAGAITEVADAPGALGTLKPHNPLPASGGRDAETDAEARARIPTALRNQDRAVSPSDYRELALQTPGLTLGRAEVLPLFKPDDREVPVPGALTLVVVPAYDPARPDEPGPDGDAARRVLDWLEPRRLVTTELYVMGPEYVPIWMSVAIEIAEGYGSSTVHGWVELALRQHFAPLPPYGPAGAGWPMGRTLKVQDVVAAALNVRGVRLVNEAQLSGAGGPAEEQRLRPWQLPVLRAVTVVTGTRAPAPDAAATAPSQPAHVVAVPVVRERC